MHLLYSKSLAGRNDSIMKKAHTISVKVLILAIAATGICSAGVLGPLVKSFEDHTEYVLPFATLTGSMTNTGWYQSAAIDKDFSFFIGLPISLVYITEKDRAFSGTYCNKGCRDCNNLPGTDCRNCIESTDYTAPTAFGTIVARQLHYSILDVYGNIAYTAVNDTFLASDEGIEGLANLSLMPFASFQVNFSLYHTELKIRYMPVPLGFVGVVAHLPGVGIQHDLASFLPELPVSLSAAMHFTFPVGRWDPSFADEDIHGELTLMGVTNFLGVIVGYKMKKVEFFLETGWEHSRLKAGGEMTVASENSGLEIVRPNSIIRGRNVFRASLNIAFSVGLYPVIGQSASANFPTNASILGYKYIEK
jgi:hypothetical protein